MLLSNGILLSFRIRAHSSFPELQEGFTDTTTPWHSDEAYWLDLSDKRALSFWFPMQDVNVSKGNFFNVIA